MRRGFLLNLYVGDVLVKHKLFRTLYKLSILLTAIDGDYDKYEIIEVNLDDFKGEFIC